MNDLAQRLQGIKDPAQADKLISGIWKGFVKTEAQQLLEITLANAANISENHIVDPGVTAEQRAFFSGQLSIVRALQQAIKASIEFDPATAEYPEPPSDDDVDLDPSFTVIGGRDANPIRNIDE